MFGGIADNWNDDHSYEERRKAGLMEQRFDAAYQRFAQIRHRDNRHRQYDKRHTERKLRLGLDNLIAGFDGPAFAFAFGGKRKDQA